MADCISKTGTSGGGQKAYVSAKDAFQDSYDHIIETSPEAKKLSLRENRAELERRRMGK